MDPNVAWTVQAVFEVSKGVSKCVYSVEGSFFKTPLGSHIDKLYYKSFIIHLRSVSSGPVQHRHDMSMSTPEVIVHCRRKELFATPGEHSL